MDRVKYHLLQTGVGWGLLGCVGMPFNPWLGKVHQDRKRGKDSQNSEVERRMSPPHPIAESTSTPLLMGDPLPLQHSTEGNVHRAGPHTAEAEQCACDEHSALESKWV